jgi:hypothetical protein
MTVVNHNHHYQTLMHLLNDLRVFRLASCKDKAKGEGKAGVIQPQDVTPTRHSGGRFGEGPATVGYGCRPCVLQAQNAYGPTFPQFHGLRWVDGMLEIAPINAICSPSGINLCTTNGAERMVSLT